MFSRSALDMLLMPGLIVKKYFTYFFVMN